LLATLAAAALAGDSHAKRQVLLPAYGVYPGFGGFDVPAYPSIGFSSFPYVTYHVSAPTVVAPAVAPAVATASYATVTTTTAAPVPADTIKVEPIAPVAPVAPVAVAAPAVVVPGSNTSPSGKKLTKISVIQTDD
ncbi:hypothetical protein PMAYCL1PPCAC_19092, partial [Pristionchus mayeri]